MVNKKPIIKQEPVVKNTNYKKTVVKQNTNYQKEPRIKKPTAFFGKKEFLGKKNIFG